MEYKKYNCNSYNIHTIKTDKFKTVRMEIIFSSEVKKEEMPLITFLCDILTDCSKKYPRRKDVAIRLEELYKATFYGVTNKIGNLFMADFVMEFIDPEYINDQNYFVNVLKFPFEVLNNPNVKNKEFDLTNFNIIKRRMINEIKSIKESPDKLAITTALEKMDKTSPSSYRVLGTVEDVEKITPANLYDTYVNLFSHSNCDIFLIGNINMDKAVEVIKDNFKKRVIKLDKPEVLVKNKMRKNALKVMEPSNFVQSTLVMIYNINNLEKSKKDTVFHVFNYLLGSGGISSKLYKNLRTDNSLCYAVRSLYLKYDELLVIEVSLDAKNVNLAQKLIRKSLKEMIAGDFTENILEDAKKSLMLSLKMSSDNNISILNNYIFNYFTELPLLDERIKLIRNVSKKDVVDCAKHLSINTIYVQEANKVGEK